MTNIFAFTRLKYALNIVFDHLVCFVFISATGLELVGGDGVADGGLAGALAESFSFWFGGHNKNENDKRVLWNWGGGFGLGGPGPGHAGAKGDTVLKAKDSSKSAYMNFEKAVIN